MALSETFQAIAPGVVAIVQTFIYSPDGTEPISPRILGTGFIVDPVGIVAANRHVIEAFSSLPVHPKTRKPAVAVILFNHGKTDEGGEYVRWVAIDIKYHTVFDRFSASNGAWFALPQKISSVRKMSSHATVSVHG